MIFSDFNILFCIMLSDDARERWEISRFMQEQEELHRKIALISREKEVANDYRRLAETETGSVKQELNKQISINKTAMKQMEDIAQQNYELERMVIDLRRKQATDDEINKENELLRVEVAMLKREKTTLIGNVQQKEAEVCALKRESNKVAAAVRSYGRDVLNEHNYG